MSVWFGVLVIVPQEKRAVKERWGDYKEEKYRGKEHWSYLKPGWSLKVPIIDQIFYRDIREVTSDIPPQSVITKDNVEVRVDGIIWTRVEPNEETVRKSFYEIDDYIDAIQSLCHTNIRQIVAEKTFDEALAARSEINKRIEENLKTKMNLKEDWGVEIKKVEIQTIEPPQDIKEAMHKQKIAEQERRRVKLEATGQKEAAEQFKHAVILESEGKKQSTINVSEGDKTAKINVATGEAKAIELVNVAADKYFTGNAKDKKALETAEASLKENTKYVLTPDLNGVVKGLVNSLMSSKEEK